MRCSLVTSCGVLIVGFFFVFIALAVSGQSPFSLESAEQTKVEGASVAPPSEEHQASSSPFSLPPETDTQNNVEDSSHSSGQLPINEEPSFLDRLTAVELQKKGTALAREGKFKDARVVLVRSLEKDPINLVTLNNLGLVMRKLGRLDDALQAYQFAIEVDDKYALTYKNLGILLEKQGKKKLAVQAYQKYCLLAPDAADVQKVTARADWLDGRK
jgi:tetratricopeptide (TPR) repeat protein